MAEEKGDAQVELVKAESEERLDLEPTPSEADVSRISPANYINILIFFANVGVFYFSEFVGINGVKFGEAMKKHQTLLSVYHEGRDDSYMIWHAIFGFELIFVFAQISRQYREETLVRLITPWWILVNTIQIAWTLALLLFADDLLIVIAGLVMANFTILMILIVVIENRTQRVAKTWLDRWKFQFENWLIRTPFSLHAGYMMCLSMMYLNSILQLNSENLEKDGEPSGVMVATSMTSITAILTLTAVFSMAIPRPDGFFCIGVAWYHYWVYRELQSGAAAFRAKVPSSQVSDEVVQAFEFAAVSVSFLAGCMAALSFMLRSVSCLQRNRVM